MNQPLWRPTPNGPHSAGDHFGDDEVTDAKVVTYRLDGKPRARVSVYFGVIRPDNTKRYAPVAEGAAELLDENGEVVDEVSFDIKEFPLDYEHLAQAEEDVREVLRRWQSTTWTVADFFDGVNLPR